MSSSSSSCELILKFDLTSDESPDGAAADDVQVVPALRHLSLGYVQSQHDTDITRICIVVITA